MRTKPEIARALYNSALLSIFSDTYKQNLHGILDTDSWCIFYCSHHRWTLRGRVSGGTGNRQFHPGVLNHRPLHVLEIQVCCEINRELYCVNMDYGYPKIKSYIKGPLISRCLYSVLLQI